MDQTTPRRSAGAEPHDVQPHSKDDLKENISRSVLVTGATGGIGMATVEALLRNGYRVWAVAHDEPGRQRLRDRFGESVHALAFDVTDSHAIANATAEVNAAGPLFGLVNNAGAALPGPLEYVPIDQFERQIDINLTGQLRVTQALLPALHEGTGVWGDARIVMMGSFDARLVGPLFGPYAASKHGLVGLADGLRCELHPARIKVVLLEPGAIATPIWSRGTGVLAELAPRLPDGGGPYRSVMEFAQRHVSTLSRRGGSPDKVATAVIGALEAVRPRPRRVVGADATIAAALVQVLPPRIIYRITALPAVWSAAAWRRRLGRSQPR
jgi:NAD(P)-dependent dehydrogenase (short-subunit alcohol dehydrogenase family)